MSPSPVVEALDILEDGLPGLPSCLEASALDAFVFQGPEKGFGDRIIVTVASAAHAHGGADIRKQSLIGICVPIQRKPCSYCVVSFCGRTGKPKSPDQAASTVEKILKSMA